MAVMWNDASSNLDDIRDVSEEPAASTIRVSTMEAERSSEASVNIYRPTTCDIPEDSHLHTRHRQNLRSHTELIKPTFLLQTYTVRQSLRSCIRTFVHHLLKPCFPAQRLNPGMNRSVLWGADFTAGQPMPFCFSRRQHNCMSLKWTEAKVCYVCVNWKLSKHVFCVRTRGMSGLALLSFPYYNFVWLHVSVTGGKTFKIKSVNWHVVHIKFRYKE
jgi:hypothetical protein